VDGTVRVKAEDGGFLEFCIGTWDAFDEMRVGLGFSSG